MKKVFCRFILPLISVWALVGVDQWSKYLTIKNIPLYGSIALIENVFELHYIQNQGMAWGMLQNKQILFIVLTPIILFGIWYTYMHMPFTKRFVPMRIAMVMMSAGAIGNMIDRMFRGEFCNGYVVDMFYVKAINFPVFNVADSFVSISFVMIVILIMFVYKDDDFKKIFNRSKKSLTEQVEQEELEEHENN